MKLLLVAEPQVIADDMYNLVAEKCDFFIDDNNETYFVYYHGSMYYLYYLSNAEDVKIFFTKLYFNEYNMTVLMSINIADQDDKFKIWNCNKQ